MFEKLFLFNPLSVNDVSRQNLLCKTQLWRIFQIGDISQSGFHQLHTQKKKYFSFFFN